jgi:glycosyltransferase involved in cell wall biosynthesis
MRILMGMPARESVGGPVACEPPFVKALRTMGIEVDEKTYIYGDKILKETKIWERIARVIRVAFSLHHQTRSGCPDLIHLNTTLDLKALLRDLVTVSFLQSKEGRIFLKLHGSDDKFLSTGNLLLRLMMRILFSKVEGIGVLSTQEREKFLSFGIDERNIFLVKCALKEGLYQRDSGFIRKHQLEEGTHVLLFIARFIPAKGLIDVIHAAHLLKNRGYKFALFCIGDGPTRQEAEDEVNRLDLRRHVRFSGYIPEQETDEFYANSDLLLYPTYHFEGLPTVILNSLAAGIPIITTRIRGAADYLSEPENCLWVEPKQPAMLAEKTIQALEHPEMRMTMSRNNRILAQNFTAKTVAHEYLEIYQQLVADRVNPVDLQLHQTREQSIGYQNLPQHSTRNGTTFS